MKHLSRTTNLLSFIELLARIMKKALRKGSGTSDDESVIKEDTDDEHHESLPHDEEAKGKLFKLGKFHGRQRKPSLVDIVQLAKSEKLKEQHPKKQFRVTKVETEDSSPSGNNENDPEVNSRIVFERRQSLLRKQQKANDDATFEVVNEKKVSGTEEPTPDKETTTERVLPIFNKRKIGSLLALVKEAVNNKRIDENDVKEKQEGEKKDEECSEDPGPMTSFPIRSDSQSGRPRTARQDSTASVWSDNIPTITISKTASEECILENQQNDLEESKQNHEKIDK